MGELIRLADGGTLRLFEGFLAKPAADRLLESLKKDVPWTQEQTRTGATFPRLTAWYADEGLTYSYSGVTHTGLRWTDVLGYIRRRVREQVGADFNSLLLNYYRDGGDSIGFHSDAEPELGQNPVVPSISLGAEREFVIKHIKTRETQKYRLPHGSLLVMGGTMQHHWLHGLPKTKEPVGERVNLTFRKIIAKAD
jgi:alkylated DNA repair dioxygenase AlkB